MTPSDWITLRRTADAQGGTPASSQGSETDAQLGRVAKGFEVSQEEGLFLLATERFEGPLPPAFSYWREFAVGEMSFHCSCPDWASMCKHVAAVLYGIGARLDAKPELLFTLRGVNHEELIEADAEKAVAAATSRSKSQRLAANEIGAVFGIEIDADNTDASSSNTPSINRQSQSVPKNLQTKKTSSKKKGKKSAKANSTVKKFSAGKTVKKPVAARKKAKRALRKTKP
jgi:hypothetical protein